MYAKNRTVTLTKYSSLESTARMGVCSLDSLDVSDCLYASVTLTRELCLACHSGWLREDSRPWVVLGMPMESESPYLNCLGNTHIV